MSEPAGEVRKNFGPYEVESVLGRGAMGQVYLARDRRIGRKVALKTVHVDDRFEDQDDADDFYKRLQREAELCGSLQHPNIVTLYEPGYDEGNTIAWLATEYVDGPSLRDHLKRRKPLPIAEALRITSDILRGLAFAHSKGIIHRDIKPGNILLTSTGDAKIADFGIARPLDSNLTAAGEMLGTPSYMSPEQVRCTAVTARSDLFSVGALLYEMVTGAKPFAAGDISGILRNVVEVDPRPAHTVHAQVPPALSSVIARLLAKKPEDRYASAAAALQDLQAIRATIGSSEEREEAGPPAAVTTLNARPRSDAADALPPGASMSTEGFTPVPRGLATPTHRFDRPIPAPLFFGIIAAVVLLLAGTALAIRLQTDPSPSVSFTPDELQHFRDKRESLAAARQLYSAGDHKAAVEAYDAYVARHPQSVVAAEERMEAREALQAEAKSAAEVNVTAKQPAKRRATTPTKKEEPPPAKKSLLRRLFGRN